MKFNVIYYYVFVVYLFVGLVFFLNLYEKCETMIGENLFDFIDLKTGVKNNIFFKLVVVAIVMLIYPVIIVLGEFDV